jgi:hypothetical protein
VRKLLPADAREIGLVASDDPETSLWKPFGWRRVIHVASDDTLKTLLDRNIRYVVLNPKKLELFFQRTFEQWLKEMQGEVVAEATLPLRVTLGPSQWFVVKLNANSGS